MSLALMPILMLNFSARPQQALLRRAQRVYELLADFLYGEYGAIIGK